MSTSRITFTRPAADRIANVVRIVEQGSRDEAPLKFSRVAEPAGGKTFRMCVFTAVWNIDTTARITFRGITSTPNTVIARNVFSTLGMGTATSLDCAIHKEGTAWYLIAARCP